MDPTHPNYDARLLDFRNFLFMIWKHLRLPDPTPVQYDVASFLDKGPRRRVITAFRGVGKSWITCAFVVWLFYKDPELKIEVISASKNLADNFSTFCLQLIRSVPCLDHLIPTGDQRDSKIQFDVGGCRDSKDPSLKSVGITGQITGTRADVIVADDVETPNNSGTQDAREKLAKAVTEFDAVLKPNGHVIYLGTPQTEESLYNILPTRKYTKRVWTARCPSPSQLASHGEHMAPYILAKIASGLLREGDPVDPDRFDDQDLTEREASYGRAGFALQFQMDTRLSDMDRYPLRLADLVVMNVDSDLGPEKVVWANGPEQVIKELPNVGFNGDRFYRPMSLVGGLIPFTGSVIAVDPAGRGKDRLGYAVVKILNGQLFVVACDGLAGGYSTENLEFLSNLCKRHKVNYGVVESNFGDGMFSALWKPILQKIWPMHLEEVRHSKQKELRIIDTLEPVMAAHKLVIDHKVVEMDAKRNPEAKHQLFYQLTRINKERGALSHDDCLDALAMAVAYWVESMSRDTDKAMDQKRERDLDDELNHFIRSTTGTGRAINFGSDKRNPRKHSWFNN